jgi:hypothetical protein
MECMQKRADYAYIESKYEELDEKYNVSFKAINLF